MSDSVAEPVQESTDVRSVVSPPLGSVSDAGDSCFDSTKLSADMPQLPSAKSPEEHKPEKDTSRSGEGVAVTDSSTSTGVI